MPLEIKAPEKQVSAITKILLGFSVSSFSDMHWKSNLYRLQFLH